MFFNYKNAPEVFVDETTRVVGADSHFAKPLLSHFLIILVKHVEEVLLDLV
jgi:hypothetical protein